MSNCAAGVCPLWKVTQYFVTKGRTVKLETDEPVCAAAPGQIRREWCYGAKEWGRFVSGSRRHEWLPAARHRILCTRGEGFPAASPLSWKNLQLRDRFAHPLPRAVSRWSLRVCARTL